MGNRSARAVLILWLGAAGCSDDGQASPALDLAPSADATPDVAAPADAASDVAPAVDAAGPAGFGQRCTPGVTDACQGGLMCLQLDERSGPDGYCTLACNSASECPSGAACRVRVGGIKHCGYACDGANPSCPNGLGCTMTAGRSGSWVCSGDPASQCQNGALEAGEACDGALLDGLDCTAFGYAGGTLSCASDCTFDTSACTGGTPCTLPPRDCTAGTSCGQLEQMLPTSGGPGFVVTAEPKHAWLRHDAFLLLTYAAAAVECVLPGSWPIGVHQASEQDGSTPKDTSGALLHPAGSHEMGFEVDIAYYQSGQPDNHPRPVCPHANTDGSDAGHCTAEPEILDIQRSAYFIAKLFEGGVVRLVIVDGKIGPLIRSAAEQLHQQHLIGERTLTLLKNLLLWETTDTGMGFYLYHHHHLHLGTSDVYRGEMGAGRQ